MAAHPDVPALNSDLSQLRRRSTHSTPPSTATRSRYNSQLNDIAKELTNNEQVEAKLRAAVNSYVLLETPRVLTPPGTASTGSSASGVNVSKGVEKIRQYLKVIERPAEAHSTQPQNAVLSCKAECNMQRYREFSRLQQTRRMDNREVFAASVQQVRAQEAPPEDDRVAAYMSVFTAQIPESVLQARASMKSSSNTASSGSSTARRLPSRALRSSRSASISSNLLTHRSTLTPPPTTKEDLGFTGEGESSLTQQQSSPHEASVYLSTPPSTAPDTLLQHQALHRIDTFVPETFPHTAARRHPAQNDPVTDLPTSRSSTKNDHNIQGGSELHSEQSVVAVSEPVPKPVQQSRTQRITFVGFPGAEQFDEENLSSTLRPAVNDSDSMNHQAAVTNYRKGELSYRDDQNENSKGSDASGRCIESETSAGSLHLLGLELSAAALPAVDDMGEGSDSMHDGGIALQCDESADTTRAESLGGGRLEDDTAKAIRNVSRIKSWCVFLLSFTLLTL